MQLFDASDIVHMQMIDASDIVICSCLMQVRLHIYAIAWRQWHCAYNAIVWCKWDCAYMQVFDAFRKWHCAYNASV